MKTIYQRLFRDFVDTMLLLVMISFIVKESLDVRPDMFLIGIISMFVLYILGVMWRMGAAIETLNENITDEATRLELHMLPYRFRHDIYKRKWQEWVFLGAVVVLLTIFVIS